MEKLIGFFFTVLLVGCISTGNQVEMDLAGSTLLVMDFGTYKAKIDKQFEYIGEMSDEVVLGDIDDSAGMRFYIKAYLFIEKSDDINNIKRKVMIVDTQLHHPEHHFSGEHDYSKSKLNDVVRAGYTDVGNVRAAYSVQSINKYSIETAMLAKIAKEKGYQMSSEGKHTAYIRYGKVIGSSRMLQIHYIETGNDDVMSFYGKSKSTVGFEK